MEQNEDLTQMYHKIRVQILELRCEKAKKLYESQGLNMPWRTEEMQKAEGFGEAENVLWRLLPYIALDKEEPNESFSCSRITPAMEKEYEEIQERTKDHYISYGCLSDRNESKCLFETESHRWGECKCRELHDLEDSMEYEIGRVEDYLLGKDLIQDLGHNLNREWLNSLFGEPIEDSMEIEVYKADKRESERVSKGFKDFRIRVDFADSKFEERIVTISELYNNLKK